MSIKIWPELTQGSPEWLQARCGILTASTMKRILTPTLKPAKNDTARAHLFDLLAQRITGHVEPAYVSDDMLRGQVDEIRARQLYAEHFTPVEEVGFITRDFGGFTIGFSPDGLVGEDGFIEIKSRRAKFQVETIIEGEMPDDFLLQVQTGFLVSGRKWCDFISYSAGLPLEVIRIEPNQEVMDRIYDAAVCFESDLNDARIDYNRALTERDKLITTELEIEQEMYLS